MLIPTNYGPTEDPSLWWYIGDRHHCYLVLCPDPSLFYSTGCIASLASCGAIRLALCCGNGHKTMVPLFMWLTHSACFELITLVVYICQLIATKFAARFDDLNNKPCCLYGTFRCLSCLFFWNRLHFSAFFLLSWQYLHTWYCVIQFI